MQFITITDYLLLPFYLMLIFFLAYQVRNKLYHEGHPWRKYFMPALTVKVFGAIFIGLTYQFHYGGGDTYHFFHFAGVINSSFTASPYKWLNLVFHIPSWYDGDYYEWVSQIHWYDAVQNYAVSSVAAVLGIFAFNTYLPTAVLFAVMSFTGIWAMFRTFATQYPTLVKHLAIAILFIPSTIIWGSGIFKDSICMFCLGWIIFAAFKFLVQREFKPFTIFMGIFCFWLIANIKIYILAAFVPAITLWIFLQYSYRIREAYKRWIIKFIIIAGGIAGFVTFAGKFSNELGGYSVEEFAKTSARTRENILSITSDEGSAYNIGTIDPTPLGLLKTFPAAVNVSLFRPYLWEARNIFSLLNAIEAFLFLVFTIKLFITVGPKNIWAAISADPNIQFFLMFSIVFAFSVGLSSGNFGTLSRYRIPCLPPYACALMLIYYRYNDANKPFLMLK